MGVTGAHDEAIGYLLPPSYTFVCDTLEDKTKPGGNGENETTSEANSKLSTEETNLIVEFERASDYSLQHSENISDFMEQRDGFPNLDVHAHSNNWGTSGMAPVAKFDYPEDEGYASATDVENTQKTARIRPFHLSPELPAIRQILEPAKQTDDADVEFARPPLITTLAATSPHSLPMLPIPRQQSSWHNGPSSYSSIQTFDDFPGLRQQSQSGTEAKRLVTVSAEATARAHHHWLRPCAVCARKAGGEGKEWSLLPKKVGRPKITDAREETSGVHKRTAKWLKKQEGRLIDQ